MGPKQRERIRNKDGSYYFSLIDSVICVSFTLICVDVCDAGEGFVIQVLSTWS